MERPQPLVTIVVCTYNGAGFLAEQLDSLVTQTYRHLEILISDDGSTDETLEIAEKYRQQDGRIVIHRNPVNLGYNKNFEQAFGLASGSFIAVSDQDDVWKKDKIEKLVGLFQDAQTLLVHGQSVRFSGALPETGKYRRRNFFEGSDVRKLMFFNTIAGHNMVFRKELLPLASPFPEGVFYDWWLALTAATYGRIAGTDDVLTFHRYHSSNLTLGKKDEKKQTKGKAGERLLTVTKLLSLPGLEEEEKDFARGLQRSLATLEGRKFSFTLFSFLVKHASIVFFFKKGSWFSKLKMAWRLSFAIE